MKTQPAPSDARTHDDFGMQLIRCLRLLRTLGRYALMKKDLASRAPISTGKLDPKFLHKGTSGWSKRVL